MFSIPASSGCFASPLEPDAAGGDRSKLLDDLDQIDNTSAKMFVPRSTVHDYIDFRQFLHDMRERIESRGQDRA